MPEARGSGAIQVMQSVKSFPAISQPDAQILVLGSIPGNVSLAAFQYYAHPRNAFWKIMGEVFDFDHTQNYPVRLQHLLSNRIALWDVAQQCVRPGSLDSNIVESSVIANDFNNFFACHRDIQRVCLNGAKAAALYKKHVLANVKSAGTINWCVLPSTSPAHAGMRYEAKLAAWSMALGHETG